MEYCFDGFSLLSSVSLDNVWEITTHMSDLALTSTSLGLPVCSIQAPAVWRRVYCLPQVPHTPSGRLSVGVKNVVSHPLFLAQNFVTKDLLLFEDYMFVRLLELYDWVKGK